MTTLEKHLISVQQKLEHLNAEVATLIALTASEAAVTKINNAQAEQSVGVLAAHRTSSTVGLNRYRQLQVSE